MRAPRLSEKNKKYITKPLQVDSNRIYITNIPYTLTEEELRGQFRRFGNIAKVKLPVEYDGKNKGYCFLTFEKSEEALRAFAECDNKVAFGRIIHVKPSLEDIGEIIKTGK
jgi:multiple RNA-binding domain-containing protein 1